jgi:hypothetical protein
VRLSRGEWVRWQVNYRFPYEDGWSYGWTHSIWLTGQCPQTFSQAPRPSGSMNEPACASVPVAELPLAEASRPPSPRLARRSVALNHGVVSYVSLHNVINRLH